MPPLRIYKDQTQTQRMKNLYLSFTLLAATLAAGTSTFAQTAKPRSGKASTAVHTWGPAAQPHQGPVTENRGGANDDCGTATAITVGTECTPATFDATDATESIPAVTCGNPPFTSPEANDLWFSFVATSAVTIMTVEGTGSFDPVLEWFTGPCDNLVSAGCADATFPQEDPPENTSETLTMATTSGTTYYARVYGYWSPVPTEFTFTLCIYSPSGAPANDLCSSVSPVALATGSAVTFTGDNTGALDTEGIGFGSVWHAFTISECANVVVDYCGTDPVFGNGLTSLFVGCPSTSVVGTDVFDQTTCAEGNASIFFEALPAGTYYYAVILDEANGAVGPYTIHVAASAPVDYCAASAATCDEAITRVTLGAIDNESACEDGVWGDYTAQSTDFIQTEIFPITVLNAPDASTPEGNSVSVWVDWNQNNAFCEGNEVTELTTDDGGLTFTGNIIAPIDALPGSTRMRVRMSYIAEGYVPASCGGADFGEVEDYTINVIQGNGIHEFNTLDWSVFPNPSNGDMTIRFAGKDAKVRIELFDVAGRTVHQEQRQLFNGQQVSLGLAGSVANGAYTLRLTSPQGRSEQRVVVQ